jgi:hypothetical protein
MPSGWPLLVPFRTFSLDHDTQSRRTPNYLQQQYPQLDYADFLISSQLILNCKSLSVF